jgi:hypothetical protein
MGSSIGHALDAILDIRPEDRLGRMIDDNLEALSWDVDAKAAQAEKVEVAKGLVNGAIAVAKDIFVGVATSLSSLIGTSKGMKGISRFKIKTG